MLKEYEAACAIVERIQDIVIEKYFRYEHGPMVLVGKLEIDHDTIKFRVLDESNPFGDDRPYPFARVSPQLSFPLAWLDMSNDEIDEEIRARERIEKEKNDRINQERLSIVLKAGVEVDEKMYQCAKGIHLDNGYMDVDCLYSYSEEEFVLVLERMKAYVEKKKKEAEEQTRNDLTLLAELKKKYPDLDESQQEIRRQRQDLPRSVV